jgi:ABC-type transport system involved in cytochrome c biogenesis permease subunit
MVEAEAFRRAVTQLGSLNTIASEFQKLNRGTWRPLQVITGIGVIVLLAMPIVLITRFDASPRSLLLAGHIFTVTLGYTATFLVGALGICFVGQRCFSDLPPPPMRSLTRITFILGSVAASLTALGIILAMVWAKAEWGRFWAWDPKETGAFSVIVWQIGFLVAHRFASRGGALLVLSVLGNIVVSLGWFGANLLSVHHSSPWNYALALVLGAAVVANLAVFFLGFAPAGCLRPRS